MKKLGLILILGGVAASVTLAKDSRLDFKSEEQKVLYTLGWALGRNISVFNLAPEELPYVSEGLKDSVLGKTTAQVDLNAYGDKINGLAQARVTAQAEARKKKEKPLLESAAKETGAQVLPSGLVYKELKAGTGPSPKASDTVSANYTGTLADGTVFDSSSKHGGPLDFPLNGVIPCWTEGIQRMKVGGKAKIVCPSSLAYGDRGQPPVIPGGAALVFEVELVKIAKPEAEKKAGLKGK
ncbi:MAG: FKBP-type peptidyl-prolyl cis-trans isomerase [Elusimicrobia bacterium]|nr:FKBP-type peptidyl-prolyl cis-trans isomerase [Elusimicrobiota bacterium]